MEQAGSPPFAKASPGAWWALAVLVILYMLNTLDRGVLSLVVAPVQHDLQITDFQMSLLLGVAFALFYALCGIPFGWLVDRFSRRMILFGGVIVWSLATIASGIVQSYPHLLMVRMLLGAGEAALAPAAHSIIADKFPKHRMATALSIYSAGAVLGSGGSIVLGGIAAGYFMTFDVIHMGIFGALRPWQAMFIWLGVPGLVLAFLVFTFREPPRLHSHDATQRLLPFLRDRKAVLLSFAGSFALLSMVIYGSLAWLPAYMGREFGWGPGRVGPTLGFINIVSAGLGTLGGGIAVDWLLRRGHDDAHLRVFFIAILCGAPAGVVGFLVKDVAIFLICIFWLKLMAFSFIGYAAAAVQIITPSGLRGRMAAIYLLALALIGNGGGPSLVAFFTDYVFTDPSKLGWALAATIAALTPLSLIAAALGMGPMREAVRAQRGADRDRAGRSEGSDRSGELTEDRI